MKNIPKICHLYWNGARMSDLHLWTLWSFHNLNPDWQIIVYKVKQKQNEFAPNTMVREYQGRDSSHMLEIIPFIIVKEIDMLEYGLPIDAPSVIGTDIFRMKILYDIGGVYSDFDVLWLKPMSEFVEVDCIGDTSDFEATVCFHKLTHGFHNVSVMIAERGSDYIDSLIQRQKSICAPYNDQIYSSYMINSMYPTLKSVRKQFTRILALPYKTFYPYSTFNLKQLYKETDLSPIENKDVMGIHWFAGNELSQEYIMSLGRGAETCSMTEITKRFL